MKITPGKYVVAVSGGVDSVVLLHMLRQVPGVETIVAHFDHGIRLNSADDAVFVESLAKQYGVEYCGEQGELGADASEETARRARYIFLNRVLKTYNADAIMTAHHQDDWIETVFINIARGTGRRGLTSLHSEIVLRPLLQWTKQIIVNYAQQYGLQWREDSTNKNPQFLRNLIRLEVVPKMHADKRKELASQLERMVEINDEIDNLLIKLLQASGSSQTINRQWFCRLSHVESKELLMFWLRLHDVQHFDRAAIERLVVACKVLPAGKQADVYGNWRVVIDKHTLALTGAER